MGRFPLLVLLCLAAWAAPGELSNRRAPGFSLPDLQFKMHDAQDYRGKVLLIDIMKTECPHCQGLSQVLEKVKAKYGDRVAILAVVNPPDNQGAVLQYVRDFKITVPILFDCGQMAASYLKVTPQNPSISVPHLFVIDRNGIIRNDFGYGPMTRQIFEGDGLFAEVDKLLKEPAGK